MAGGELGLFVPSCWLGCLTSSFTLARFSAIPTFMRFYGALQSKVTFKHLTNTRVERQTHIASKRVIVYARPSKSEYSTVWITHHLQPSLPTTVYEPAVRTCSDGKAQCIAVEHEGSTNKLYDTMMTMMQINSKLVVWRVNCFESGRGPILLRLEGL